MVSYYAIFKRWLPLSQLPTLEKGSFLKVTFKSRILTCALSGISLDPWTLSPTVWTPSLIMIHSLGSSYFMNSALPNHNTIVNFIRLLTSISFAENQLSLCSFGISPLATGPPKLLQQLRVRPFNKWTLSAACQWLDHTVSGLTLLIIRKNSLSLGLDFSLWHTKNVN